MRIRYLAAALALWAVGASPISATSDGQIRPEPDRGGAVDLASTDIEVAVDRLKPAAGYEISLFASEKEFPEIANPLAMTFDTRGRLWVLASPTRRVAVQPRTGTMPVNSGGIIPRCC